MGCLSSGNLKEGKVGTTSPLTLVLWTTIVKLPNPADQQQTMVARPRPQRPTVVTSRTHSRSSVEFRLDSAIVQSAKVHQPALRSSGPLPCGASDNVSSSSKADCLSSVRQFVSGASCPPCWRSNSATAGSHLADM